MSLTSELKAFARNELGFHLVGVTSPDPFPEADVQIGRWLAEGHNGEMAWLNAARAHFATRPRELMADARSLIVFGVSYRTEEPSAGTGGRIARYAWGSDYHDAMKTRLRRLAAWLSERAQRAVRSRVFVDDGPLVERDAAIRAGLGFRGKNTNLLTSIGSYVFLGALLTDVDLTFDEPVQKDCGSCRACIDACPTAALDEPYHLAAERCIAYLTIEHRGPISEELRPKIGDWVFGCDICQEVCPYNASSRRRLRGWPEFEPRLGTRLELDSVLEMDDSEFRATFRGSPIKRTKRRGLVRNAALALGNVGGAQDWPALERVSVDDPDPVVREAAQWALRQQRGAPPGPAGARAEDGRR